MAKRFLSNINVNDQYTLPSADGTSGQIIQTDGSGNLSFVDFASNEARKIIFNVKNKDSISLSKGTVVHASPSANPPSGNIIEVIRADNNDSSKMPAIGVLNETLAVDAEGECVMLGSVSGIATNSFNVGDELYVSDTPGEFINTKPTGTSNLIQKIAIVIKSHSTNGLIEVFGAGRANDVPNQIDRNVNFTDNSKLTFGDSTTPDFQIYHDGSDSFIKDSGTGELRVPTSTFRVTRADDAATLLMAQDSGAVELYNNGSKKFETTSTGVSVTGQVALGEGASSKISWLGNYGNWRINISDSANQFVIHSESLVADYFTVIGGGGIKLNAYGSGNKTGTAAYNLSVDSNGNIIETDGGVVDGSGTANDVAMWSDSNTLTDAPIAISGNNATFAGIVTTDKIFVAKGQNVTHGTSQLKISQENTTKSQIRFYGADTSTAGILEFTGSSSDGSAGGVRLTINADGSSTFAGDITVTGGDLTLGTDSIASNINAVGDVLAINVDSNTGGGAGANIQLKTAGTSQLTINSSSATFAGSVGIGTDSPSATKPTGSLIATGWGVSDNKALEISAPNSASNGANSGLFLRNSNNSTGTDITSDNYYGNTFIDNRYDNDNGDIYFRTRTAGTPQTRMIIEGGGNVGIGTTSPSSKLHVVGEARVYTGSSLGYWGVDAGNSYVYLGTNTSNYSLSFQTSGSEKMRIDSSGRVGIGGSPANKLHIQQAKSGSSAENYDLLRFNLIGTGAIGDSSSIVWYSTSGTKTAGIDGISGQDNILYGELAFNVRKYTTDSFDEAMRINNRGNVGIGTSSPSYKLQVSGVQNANDIVINNTTTGVNLRLQMIDAYGFMFTTGSKDLLLGTNNTERMRIDSSGLVRIQKNTASTTEPLLKLSNANGSTTDGVKMIFEVANTSGNGGEISVVRDGGSFNPYMTFNVSSGVASAPTERMRIDSSGRVGINQTSPSSFFSNASQLVIGDGSTSRGMTIYGSSAGDSQIFFADGTTGNQTYRGVFRYEHSSDSMVMFTSATERMRIDSAGNVGIGTTSIPNPFSGAYSNILQVGTTGGNTRLAITAGSTSSSDLSFADSNDATNAGSYVGAISYKHNGDYMLFSTNGSEKMRITSGGQIRTQTSGGYYLTENTTNAFSITSNGANGYLAITDEYHSAERIRIDNSGRVGVGTTSILSGNKLDVRGGNIMVGGFGGGTDYGLILTPDDGSGYWNIANVTSGALTFNNSATIGSSEQMRLTTTGLGIGGTPSRKLHIYNTASADVALLESTQVFSTLAFKSSTNSSTVTVGIDGAGNAAFENKLSSGNMTFVTNGSERMRIQSNGNVLIGATGATNTRLKVVQTTASEWACQITNTGATSYGLAIDTSANTGVYALGVYTNTGTGLFVKNDGKVGIGTTSPDFTGFGWNVLTVQGGTGAGNAGVLELAAPSTNANGQNLGIVSFNSGNTRNAQIAANRDSANNDGRLSFWTSAGSGGIEERMRITSAGAIEIKGTSTTSQAQAFITNDNSVLSIGSSVSGSVVKDIQFNSPSPMMYIDGSTARVGIGTTSPDEKLDITGGYLKFNGGDYGIKGSAGLTYYATSEHYFYTGGTERMRINSSGNTTFAGNVGIGGAPGQNLDIQKSGARFRMIDGTNQFNMGLWDGANYRFEGDANRPIYMTSYEGNINFGISGGITMTIQNGKVGIGTASPAAPLDVQGTSALFMTRTSGGLATYIENDGGYPFLAMYQIGAGARVLINTNGNSYFNGGNVGIGTTSPLEKLNIVETTTTAGTFFPVAISGARYQADYGVGIAFRPENNSSAYANKTAIVGSGGGYGYNMADLHFCFNNSTTITDEVSLSDAKVTMKRSGNVGIGTTAPTYKLQVNGTGYINETLYVNGATTVDDNLYVTAGNVGIGTTSPSHKLYVTESGSQYSIAADYTGTNGSYGAIACQLQNTSPSFIDFYLSSSLVGAIVTNGSNVLYQSYSDYRLKENAVEMTGALDRVNNLKPKRFNFISQPDTEVDGFFAHELQEIVPQAVTGEKDEVNDDGTAKYQGVDNSQIVPLLVGAIQELKAEIENLKSQINN